MTGGNPVCRLQHVAVEVLLCCHVVAGVGDNGKSMTGHHCLQACRPPPICASMRWTLPGTREHLLNCDD